MQDEFAGYDAIGLGELIRKKELKPTNLLEMTIHRVEKINPKLNAIIHKMYAKHGKGQQIGKPKSIKEA